MHITTFSTDDAKMLCQLLIDYGVTFSTRGLANEEWGFEFDLSDRLKDDFMREIEDMLMEEPIIKV